MPIAAGNNKRLCIVFLMEAVTPPDCLDRPKKPLPSSFVTGVCLSIPHSPVFWEDGYLTGTVETLIT